MQITLYTQHALGSFGECLSVLDMASWAKVLAEIIGAKSQDSNCSKRIVEDLVWKAFVFVHCAQWATCNMLCAQLMCFEMCTVHQREAGRLWEDGSEWVSQLVTWQGLKLPFTSTSATLNYNLAEFSVGCKWRCLTLVMNVVVGLVCWSGETFNLMYASVL